MELAADFLVLEKMIVAFICLVSSRDCYFVFNLFDLSNILVLISINERYVLLIDGFILSILELIYCFIISNCIVFQLKVILWVIFYTILTGVKRIYLFGYLYNVNNCCAASLFSNSLGRGLLLVEFV